MAEKQTPKFVQIFGIALGSTVVLTVLYSLITGLSLQNWANALCVGSLLLGAASIVPLFFDAGRGFTMATKLGSSDEERDTAMVKEKQKREKGMVISFALAAAMVLIGILSAILSFV